MNETLTKERLPLKPRPMTTEPMAARAVALCEGCPMAKFCAIKTVAPCETPVQRETQIESGGDYSGGSLDKPVAVQMSYRRELMDDRVPFVMANLQKKKEQIAPRPTPVSQQSTAVRSATRMTLQPTPVRQAAPTPKKLPTKPERRNETSDIVADILVSLFGVQSITSAHAKKSV
jgi:hypothetical protein